jgi:ribonuclease HI
MQEFIIHTDGGCSGNPGPGAWAYVMRYGDRLREDSGFEPDTTNNKMELQAVIEALTFLSSLKRVAASEQSRKSGDQAPSYAPSLDPSAPRWLSSPVKVYTDSQYVKNGVGSWLKSWKAKGWKTADKKPVKNQDLWMKLDSLVQEIVPEFFWVEGHAGNPDNERCDSLVRDKVKTMRNK